MGGQSRLETLKDPRSTGQICFCWYRITITIPPEAAGKAVFFQTTVDDYGEIWVDGNLPRTPGKGGEAIVAGFNAPTESSSRSTAGGRYIRSRYSRSMGPFQRLHLTGCSSKTQPSTLWIRRPGSFLAP